MTAFSNDPPIPDRIRVHILVEGLVQGVGYRYHTQRTANRLGLAGWVRNIANGQVEAVFEGPEAAVSHMLTWCHDGPPAAVVTEITITPAEVEGLTGFQILR